MASRKPYVSDAEMEVDDSGSDRVNEKPYNEKTGAPEEMVQEVDLGTVQDLAAKLGETQNGMAPVDDIEHVMDKVNTLTVQECRAIIEAILEDHKWDYNFAAAQKVKLTRLLEGPTGEQTQEEWELEIKTEAAINKFYSPYPEVRAVATPDDDENIPCETIRAHFLGYVWACVAQFINSLFNSRYPAITFYSAVAQILLYPCGVFLAWALPDWGITIRGTRHSLNPGPWTYKEQVLATIITDVGLTSAYVFWNIQTETVYYGDTWLTPGYKILLLLSTQLMGLGFAGMLRRFVVYPVEAIWPSILPTLALNRALLVPEKKETINGWSMSRYKFFFIFFFGMFFYFWLPDFLFNALSYFSWMAWIAPNNFKLALVTGSDFGLGFNPISSLDWNIFATYSSPLTYPFFSFVQQYIGTMLGGFIILGMYLTNYKWTAYLPPNSSGIFDNTGNSYNVTQVMTNGVVDEALYKAYSPPFYSAANLLVYGAFFAYYPMTFVFIILDQWRQLSRAYRAIGIAGYKSVRQTIKNIKDSFAQLAKGQVKQAFTTLIKGDGTESSIYDDFDDPFTNMMRKYPEVPDWWFLCILLVSLIFALILLTQFQELKTPVWTIFFVIALNLVFLIPMTYLYSVAGTTEGLNVLTELIIGYALPGHPEALMFVKAYGYNINGQADSYISDQKMGLYAKVPPRAMYRGQLMSAIITAFVAYGVVDFVDGLAGICTSTQKAKFNCENGSEIYYASSVIWGAIGPKRTFGQIYPKLKYAFLIGFLLAIVWWAVKVYGGGLRQKLAAKMPPAIFKPLNTVIFTPISWLQGVHPSLVINGMLWWAPLNLAFFTSGLYFSVAFMFYLRRYKTAWWEKYNYVLAAAFSGGVAFSGLIIFFAVQYNPITVDWWGNNVVDSGVDGFAGQTAYITTLPAKGYFGPDTWY